MNHSHPTLLLPWYVNGTLAVDERALVTAHIADCSACRDEIELLTLIQHTVATESVPAPGDLIKQKILGELQKTRQLKPLHPNNIWTLALATAAALIIVVESSLLFQAYRDPALSTQLAGSNQSELRIRFKSHARADEIAQLLESVQADIIGGPTNKTHFYTLRIRSLDKQAPKVHLETLIKQLKSHSELVDYVDQD